MAGLTVVLKISGLNSEVGQRAAGLTGVRRNRDWRTDWSRKDQGLKYTVACRIK